MLLGSQLICILARVKQFIINLRNLLTLYGWVVQTIGIHVDKEKP